VLEPGEGWHDARYVSDICYARLIAYRGIKR
jgi:hypothetical protein